jgi:hypothetical protein
MIQRTVEEQQRALYWHRRRERERMSARNLLRESDELMYWLEECLLQGLRIVPGWVMPRLVALLSEADPDLPRELGHERRPSHVMEFVYRAQERLMEQSVKARRPARIIPLFRRRR